MSIKTKQAETAEATVDPEAPEQTSEVTQAPKEPKSEPRQAAPVAPRRPAPMVRMDHASETHPLVQHALQSGPLDTETLGALMALQREWDEREAKKAFTRAMVAMKGELPTVLGRDKRVDYTTKTGGRTTYTHTSLAAAVEAITPHVCTHGFSAAFTTRVTTERSTLVEVTCTLTHHDGHAESCSLSAPPDKSGMKSDAQAVASTVTLLQRYTLLSLLGIATKDHDDPQPAGTPTQTKTVDEIVKLFRDAKAPAHVRDAKKAWSDIKSTITPDDRDELTLELEEAVARIGGKQS